MERWEFLFKKSLKAPTSQPGKSTRTPTLDWENRKTKKAKMTVIKMIFLNLDMIIMNFETYTSSF